MASAFELHTLAEIAILNVAVSRILTHLAKATSDPNSFLSAELASGLESLAKTNYWSVSHKIKTRFWRLRKADTRKSLAKFVWISVIGAPPTTARNCRRLMSALCSQEPVA